MIGRLPLPLEVKEEGRSSIGVWRSRRCSLCAASSRRSTTSQLSTFFRPRLRYTFQSTLSDFPQERGMQLLSNQCKVARFPTSNSLPDTGSGWAVDSRRLTPQSSVSTVHCVQSVDLVSLLSLFSSSSASFLLESWSSGTFGHVGMIVDRESSRQASPSKPFNQSSNAKAKDQLLIDANE